MKPKIHSSIIFRTPKFSYQANLSACWDELKAAISISSAAFYETIKNVQVEDLQNLPPKVYFTIWKYFNRAKYRSTPYGTFASFSFLANAFHEQESKITVNEEQIVHQFIDWPYRNELDFDFKQLITDNTHLFSNSSYYRTHNSIRYIACTDGVFELAEIDDDDFVSKILDICSVPIAVHALAKELQQDDDGKNNLLELLSDMHAIQLIFSDLDPNVIGQDYFDRIGIETTIDKPQYLIAQRKILSGGLDETKLKPLPGLIELLSEILKAAERDALKSFTHRFKLKFDQQEIPLSIALDPEMGVGYDELEQAGTDDFVAQFNANKKKEGNKNDLKAALKSSFSTESFKNGETVFLNKLTFDTHTKAGVLPNTFSLLMSLADDLICIDQIGGATANALTGRFSIADAAVENFCKESSKIEQSANPDVLFFDVAYLVETNVDNINRRKLVYDHQLSILNFDTSNMPLALHDIRISVRNNEVILRSEKLNKRLIPRMASAYNYSRSDLSVFRLLCDLQHQGIQTSLLISLESIFPDLDFYPRFQYHNIVLSGSKWRVDKKSFYPDKIAISIDACRAYLHNLGLTRFFKCGLSDQTLCFDLHCNEDLTAFLQFMQKQTKIYLEEVIFPVFNSVEDQLGQPYLAQFILNINHTETIYKGVSSQQISHTSVQNIFLPGKEWLYFEIFCHQQRSDELLVGVIPAFLNEFSENIKSWFFIRYNENGSHLRLRILLKTALDGQKLTTAFSDYLKEYIDGGIVSDLQLKTYRRELERYGSDLIEKIEAHFSVDSTFVISLLQNGTNAFDKYKWCSAIVDGLGEAEVFDSGALIRIIKLMSDSFNKEHHLEATDFKKLNQQYQVYRNSPDLTESDLNASFVAFKRSFIALLEQVDGTRRIKLFTDLMHMYVNRLFSSNQRTNEMIMYYFLLKDMQRKNAIG